MATPRRLFLPCSIGVESLHVMKIHWNAPTTLELTGACFIVMLCSGLAPLPGLLAAVGPPSVDLRYFSGLVSYPLAHGDWNHFFGNISLLLILAPRLEECYGSVRLAGWFLFTTIVIGLAHTVLADGGLIGASGLVFFCITLSSMSGFRSGEVPLTLVLVALLFLGKELIALAQPDMVSQTAHLLGGLCGIIAGFLTADESSRVRRV